MKSTTKKEITRYCAVLTLMGAAVATAENILPQNKPGYDKSKDLGVEAPEGADVPFDGTMESIEANWEMWPQQEMPITWTLVKSPTDDTKVLMTNGGKSWGTHDLVTKKKYKDFEGHVEFVLMGSRGDDKAEGYANSGVYLQNRHELQIESPKGADIEDPFNWSIGRHGIGAVCMEHEPKGNAWRPNGEWHSFHFVFTSARWEGEKLVEPAHLTLWWNGLKVHDNVLVKHANGGVQNGPSAEGLKLQEHGLDVRFRNIWIKPGTADGDKLVWADATIGIGMSKVQALAEIRKTPKDNWYAPELDGPPYEELYKMDRWVLSYSDPNDPSKEGGSVTLLFVDEKLATIKRDGE